MNALKELFRSKELLVNLVQRELKGRYRRTALGQLWSLINPLASMIVYSVVFGLFFGARPRVGDPSGLNIYALWLLCGLLPWQFFSGVLNGTMSSLTSNTSLIKKVYFPRIALPVSVVGARLYNLAIEIGLLVLALLIVGGPRVLPWVPLVALMMLVLGLFALGFGMILSIWNAHFRDVNYLVSILLQFWMYMTPIIYPTTLVYDRPAARENLWFFPFSFWDIYQLNPMMHFVSVFRSLLYDQTWPHPPEVIACVLIALVFGLLGFIVFDRSQKKLAELL